jgi:hypothetical protein
VALSNVFAATSGSNLAAPPSSAYVRLDATALSVTLSNGLVQGASNYFWAYAVDTSGRASAVARASASVPDVTDPSLGSLAAVVRSVGAASFADLTWAAGDNVGVTDVFAATTGSGSAAPPWGAAAYVRLAAGARTVTLSNWLVQGANNHFWAYSRDAAVAAVAAAASMVAWV